MGKEMACRKCKRIAVGTICPTCNSSDLTPDWNGIIMIFDPLHSKIAKSLGIIKKGKYALKVI